MYKEYYPKIFTINLSKKKVLCPTLFYAKIRKINTRIMELTMQDTEILDLATVPEHSVNFMRTVSGGAYFVQDDYLCFSADDWLTIIGYPLKGAYKHESFLYAKQKAVERTHATSCFAIAPDLPPEMQEYIEEKDIFYTLPTHAKIPTKLINPIAKARQKLRVEMSNTFSTEHRRLWTEFMARVPLKNKVRSLFASTAHVLAGNVADLYLLNAWDEEGHLTASLLLDFAPQKFCAYILGAHSKKHYAPHAADLLFAHMIEIAKEKGKEYIHLGLGVNEGITRFKKKWGGTKALPFVMASWQEHASQGSLKLHAHVLLRAVMGAQQMQGADLSALAGLSKREIWANLPEQRPYAMLWEVQKNDRISWIGGSAHFFCYSFERSFTDLFEQADTVIFEGPLDNESLLLVEAEGKKITPDQQPLFNRLNRDELHKLSRMVRGPEGFWPKLLNVEAKRKIDVTWFLQHTRPWTALFTLWTGFLERQGWQQSVDLEAWNLAHSMGKTVVAMESLEEQLASLNSVPPDRVVRYFQNCHRWPAMIKRNVKSYLAGDLMRLMGTSAEFPTRTETIISKRDERFRQRMRPFMEQGRCVVFVGTAHMLNLRNMLTEDGFTLRQVRPTLKHKLYAKLHNLSDI